MMRLQKYMALSGVASRRHSEKYILAGEVTVNGQVVTELGVKVDEYKDQVMFRGKLVAPVETNLDYVFHKPSGVVTTVTDQHDRKTVMDYFDDQHRIYPVGRLDYDTSGLLLMTNDGDFTYAMTHPKHEIDKVYEVTVNRLLKQESLRKLERGCHIGPYAIAGSQIRLLSSDSRRIRYQIIIHEGKNRQIRHMIEYGGARVLALKRLAIGQLTLGSLPVGHYRPLTNKEKRKLLALC